MQKPISLTLKDIPAAAETIAKQLSGGEILGLVGPLGSGKTAFVKALAKGLKVKLPVVSPTFVLMNILPAVLPKTRRSVWLVHVDLYRTRGFKEVKFLGLGELWGKKNALTVIEWADKIKKFLPPRARLINFNHEKFS